MEVQEMSQIEKSVFIQAPRSKVWKALTDSAEFAKWFQVKVDSQFVPGQRVNLESTYPGHEGVKFFLDVDEFIPESRFSWRWSPNGPAEPGETPTRVVFELQERDGGTLLKVTESGFDGVSLARRAKAFTANDHGWTLQMQNIQKYVSESA